MAATFPDLVFRVDDRAGKVTLEGTVVHRAECGVPTKIHIRVTFPDNYPEGEPTLFETGKLFPRHPDRHIGPDGDCCLWLPPESRWDADDPDALLRFLEEGMVFFDRQLVLSAQPVGEEDRWPGPERGHGDEGYAQFLQELIGDARVAAALAPVVLGKLCLGRNDRCPCGSGRKYKSCHMELVGDVISIAPQARPYRCAVHTARQGVAQREG